MGLVKFEKCLKVTICNVALAAYACKASFIGISVLWVIILECKLKDYSICNNRRLYLFLIVSLFIATLKSCLEF